MSNPTLPQIEADIAELPPESQLRVDTLADMFRDLMARDSESEETVFAMLLVMKEWEADEGAVELALSKGVTWQ